MSRALLLLLCCLALGTLACRTDNGPLRAPVHAGMDIPLAPDVEAIRGVIPPRTTLETLLRDQGRLGADVVRRVILAARSAFDPRRLRAAQPYLLELTADGRFWRFDYEIDAETYLRVGREPARGELVASVLPIPRERAEVTAAGNIGGATPSLYQAVHAAGERPELTIAMAEIFSGEVDFNTELQPGDRFALTFEKFTRVEGPATYGVITAAEMEVSGRLLRAIRFTPPGGQPAYYDENGRSLRRFFLRSPLKFEPRITSGFSRRRFHPVLKSHRPHLGVDYGAPTGSPVVAVAAGKVVSATSDRANGRMVRLRHAGGFETYYLHLSAFAPGVRAGRRVEQGQIIGRVGSTGLASGPHLDYRLRKNGVFVDPVREHKAMPPGEPVPAHALDAFAADRDDALENFAEVNGN